MARRLIIDDRTGVLYEDFTSRRIASLDEFFNAEAGATETVEVFSINVNPQTRAVTANPILTANVSLDIGVPRAKPTGGKLTVTYGSDTSGEIPIETLTAETLSSALNRLDAMETAGGCDVWRAGEDDSELSFYVRLQNNGAPGTNPSFDCDGATPPAIGEVTVVKTGASSERALWLVTIAEKPVASIAESAWSTVTSGSFGGLTASLALNGAGLLAHLSKEDPGDLTLTVKNSSSALYRGTLRAFPSVDPNDLNGSSIHAIFPQIVTSGSNPTVNDDVNDGFGVGTLWINSSTPSAFLLMANGAGAANWDEITETGTGQLLAANNLSDLASASTARTNLGAQATITGAATTIDTEDLTASRAVVSNGSGKVAVSDVTSTELGYLDGVSSAIQTQLDAKQATITGAATTIDTEDLTASRAVVSNGSGKVAVSDVTSTEIGYLDGVSSAIQTQINAKQATITGAATTIDTEDLTASRAVVSNGSGKVAVSDVTSTELGYLDGVSSAVQTQLDAKLPLAGGTLTGSLVTKAVSHTITTTSSSSFSAAVTDRVVAVNYSGAATVYLPNDAPAGTVCTVYDAYGYAGTAGYEITVMPYGGTIENRASAIINIAHGTLTFINDSSDNWRIIASGSKPRISKNDQTGSTYTLTAGDVNKTVRINYTSGAHTVTVPNNTIPEGEVIHLFAKSSGGVTIAAATGVTINSVGSRLKLANQYSGATLISVTKGASSEFDLVGDLKA